MKMNNDKEYYWLDEFSGVNGPDQWSRLQELWSRNVISNETEICAVDGKNWVKYKTALNSSKPVPDANQRLLLEPDGIGTGRQPPSRSQISKENPRKKSPTPSLTKLKISLVVCSTLALLFGITCIWLIYKKSKNSNMNIPAVSNKMLNLNIEGSVFIVTKDDSIVKMSLVPIKVCESHVLHECLIQVANNIVGCDYIRDYSKPYGDFLFNEYTNCFVKLINMRDVERKSAWENFHKKINTSWLATPTALSFAWTDADGKFKMTVKSQNKCSLIAISARKPYHKIQRQLWVIPLTSEPNQTIILSYHNMMTNLDHLLHLIQLREGLPSFNFD